MSNTNISDNSKFVGSRIDKLRVDNGLSIRELAKKSFISHNSLFDSFKVVIDSCDNFPYLMNSTYIEYHISSFFSTFLKKFFEISEISSSEVILIVNRFYSLLIVIISMKFITSLLALSP